MLEKKLQVYIDKLSSDIERLKKEEYDYDYIRNLVVESDLRLLEDIKDDLEQLMKGAR